MRHLPADKVTAKRWLLPGDPFRVDKIAVYLDDITDLGWAREFRMIEGTAEGINVGVCSTGIGGPSTAIAVHELKLLGATHLVRVGTCGSFVPYIRVGDTVVATHAVSRTLHLYHPDAYLTKAIRADYREVTYSSDWFYSDDHPAVAATVEMEAAALFATAQTLDMRAACICAVSDDKEVTDYEAGIDRAIIAALDGIVQ